MPVKPPPQLTAEQLGEVLGLLRGADSAELKLTVPEGHHYGTLRALQIDPLEARMRQIFFFDTPDLALNAAGVVVRARRIQDAAADTVVKLRPVVPDDSRKACANGRRSASRSTRCPAGSCVRDPQRPEHERRREGGGGGDATHPQALLERPTRVLHGARARRHRPRRPRRARADPRPQAEDRARGVRAQARGRALELPRWIEDLELSTKCSPTEAFEVAAEAKAHLAFDRGLILEQTADEDRIGSAVLRRHVEGRRADSG